MPKATEPLSMYAAIIQMRARLAQASAVADLVVFHMNKSDAPTSQSFDRVAAAIEACRDITADAVDLTARASAMMTQLGKHDPKLRLVAG